MHPFTPIADASPRSSRRSRSSWRYGRVLMMMPSGARVRVSW